MIQIIIVFVLILVNKVEIPCHHPGSYALSMNFPEFLQKLYLLLSVMWSIYACEPPGAARKWTELNRSAMDVHTTDLNIPKRDL
jgi:hypothetical protein